MKTIILEPMQAIMIGSGQLHTFQRIDKSVKMHWSIAWDFVNCSPVPEQFQTLLLSKSILYAMDQHDQSLQQSLNEKCTEDITLIRQIIVEAATVHKNIPDHYVLPFLQIVREELVFVKQLLSIGMTIPNLSILHGTQKNSEAFGIHRCMFCFRSLCNTLVVENEDQTKFLCHTCCVDWDGNANINKTYLVNNCKVEMHFMSLIFMEDKVNKLQVRFNTEPERLNNAEQSSIDIIREDAEQSSIDIIREDVKSTLKLFNDDPIRSEIVRMTKFKKC